MDDEDIYAITNIEGYAREMRDAAAKSLSDSQDEDLDQYISMNQMINLVKTECVGFDDNDRPLLNEDANEKIYESTVTWIHNVGLAKLAAQGYLECAWDEKNNEMVFWRSDIGNSIVKEKGKSNGKSNKRRNSKKNKGS